MRELFPEETKLLTKLSGLGSIEIGLFEVTTTQLEKSIIDANFLIRKSFLTTRFHDFENQEQGNEEKVLKKIFFFSNNSLSETSMSLYRPSTKEGDPRLWIYNFTNLSPDTFPKDVIAIIQNGTDCICLNISLSTRKNQDLQTIYSFFATQTQTESPVALELLKKLETIASRGPIITDKKGAMSIGFAVEDALGIKPNNSKKPDYKGVELKSSRSLSGNKEQTLFSKIFDRKLSPTKSHADLLDKYGYLKEDGLKHLFCTVDALSPNPQGLKLSVDLKNGFLNEFWHGDSSQEHVCLWKLDELTKALKDKHAETFWIEAEETKTPNGTGFILQKVIHTSSPRLSLFSFFLSDGTIVINHRLRRTLEGKVRDRGLAFRTKARNLKEIFKVEGVYEF